MHDPRHATTPPALFVMANGHSGSTMLEMLLATRVSGVGLGELGSTLAGLRTVSDVDRLRSRTCLCGQDAGRCEFWSTAIPDLEALMGDGPLAPRAGYGAVVSRFIDLYPGTTLVDSSKNPRHLAALDASWPGQVRVVHLVRDVRSWSVSSRRKLEQVHSGEGGVRGLLRRRHRTHLARFRRWHEGNAAAEQHLQQRGLGYTSVSYEGLTTSEVEYLDQLVTLLDLPPAASADGVGRSHALHGNRARTALGDGAAITYSADWMFRRGWALASLLRPGVMRDDRRWVGDTLHRPLRRGPD